MDSVQIRKANLSDVPRMAELINLYAQQGIMLPKSIARLYENIRDFSVLEEDNKLIGCGALHIYWENLAEVRSLVIDPDQQRRGLGKKIVDYLLDEARGLSINVIFALSFKPEFFKKLGFHEVEKETLPHKIWKDCLDCPHFPNCAETAIKINLNGEKE